MAPRPAQNVRNRLAQQLQIVTVRDHTGSRQHQVIVVGGEALEDPEQAGVHFPIEFIGHEGSRLDPLHMPCVKVLMTGQTEKAAVAITG